MRQDEHTKAYEDAADGTVAYGTSASEPRGVDHTRAYGTEADETDPTQVYESDRPVHRTHTHGLGPGDDISLNGLRYVIDSIISGDHETGEAIVYRVRQLEADRLLAVKLYYEFRDPRHEPNEEALARIKSLHDEDILRLHDYGTGSKKYQKRYCFEVADYAQGGNLLSVKDVRAKYTTEFVRNALVPQLVRGLTVLHEQRIVHCDVKPSNIFYLDDSQEDLVIGDYGSAKTFEENSSADLRHTSIVKGTAFYHAPEQANQIISEKNDYYSMGMLLLHLLYPEIDNRESHHRIYERRERGLKIWEFNPSFGDLNYLIEGLTLSNRKRRWGREEVERWMRNEPVEVIYSDYDRVTPIRIGDELTIFTEAHLIAYLEEADDWHELLLEEDQGKSLLEWFGQVRNLQQRRTLKEMISFYQPKGPAYLKEAVLRYLDPQRPIDVDMQRYTLPDGSLADQVTKLLKQLYDSRGGNFAATRFHLFQLEFALRQRAGQGSREAGLILEILSAKLALPPAPEQWDYKTAFDTRIDGRNLQAAAFEVDPVWAREQVRERIENSRRVIPAGSPLPALLNRLEESREVSSAWTNALHEVESQLAEAHGECNAMSRQLEAARADLHRFGEEADSASLLTGTGRRASAFLGALSNLVMLGALFLTSSGVMFSDEFLPIAFFFVLGAGFLFWGWRFFAALWRDLFVQGKRLVARQHEWVARRRLAAAQAGVSRCERVRWILLDGSAGVAEERLESRNNQSDSVEQHFPNRQLRPIVLRLIVCCVALAFVWDAWTRMPSWSSSVSSHHASPSTPREVVVVSATNLRLRQRPSTQANVLATLTRGTRLELVSRSGSWYEVELQHEGRRLRGWVHGDHVTPLAASDGRPRTSGQGQSGNGRSRAEDAARPQLEEARPPELAAGSRPGTLPPGAPLLGTPPTAGMGGAAPAPAGPPEVRQAGGLAPSTPVSPSPDVPARILARRSFIWVRPAQDYCASGLRRGAEMRFVLADGLPLSDASSIPAGTQVIGEVSGREVAASVGDPDRLAVRLTSIFYNGQHTALGTNSVSLELRRATRVGGVLRYGAGDAAARGNVAMILRRNDGLGIPDPCLIAEETRLPFQTTADARLQ